MNSKPRFKVVHSSPEPEDLEPCSLVCLQYKAKSFNLTGLYVLDQETVEIYRILRYLIAKTERVLDSQKVGMEAEFESSRSYTDQLMHRVIALIQYKIPQPNYNALIYTMIGNAALAHVVMFTRNAPPQAGVPILMSTRYEQV